jgi:ATP phosphoribosyltransferase regulatory subunit
MRAAGLAAERQIAQAGIELIGHDSPEADAEIVQLGTEALAALGLTRISFDLTLPPLVPTLLQEAGLPAQSRAALGRALDRKDAAAVAEHGGSLAGTLTDLLLAAGPADRALDALFSAALPPGTRVLADRLAATVAAIRARVPALRLTVDPVEFRGLRYHTGVTLTVFAPGRHEELARGGRYLCGEAGEPATGLTLYPDAVLRAAPPRAPRPRIFLPAGTDPTRAAALRAEGYATVAALDPGADPAGEARRLACGFFLTASGPVALTAE